MRIIMKIIFAIIVIVIITSTKVLAVLFRKTE